MFHIRPFQASDLPFILEIEEAVFPHPWSANSFLTFSKDPHFWLAVACHEEKPVGYYVAQVIPPEAELHNIAVHSAWQRKGVGRELLKYFLDKLNELHVKNIFLLVRESNSGAVQLYQKFDFKFLEKRRGYYLDPKEDALVFYKSVQIT